MIGKSKTTRAFDPHEKRALTLRAERLDPKHLVKGKSPFVEAEHSRIQTHAWGKARHYELTMEAPGTAGGKTPATVSVQLNHGDPADDETRLAEIMESNLAPIEIAELEPRAKI